MSPVTIQPALLFLHVIKSGMATGSKIRYFFIPLIFAFLPVSCEKNKNDVIPDEYVNFTLDLKDYQNIYNIIGSDTVNKYDLRIYYGREYAGGYNDNGIIIYFSGEGYCAFDRTCPHDFKINGISVKVKVDFIQARCPKCGTLYALSASGDTFLRTGSILP